MIKTDIHGDIGVISVDRPPVNAINPELVSSLTESLDSFNNNDSINGVILEGRSGIFSAGLDITHLFPKDHDYIWWGKISGRIFQDCSIKCLHMKNRYTHLLEDIVLRVEQ